MGVTAGQRVAAPGSNRVHWSPELSEFGQHQVACNKIAQHKVQERPDAEVNCKACIALMDAEAELTAVPAAHEAELVAVGVWIDIVEDGPTMDACRTTGSLSQSIEPDLDDFGIWAKVEAGVTTVRRLTTDEIIVQARGWAKAMQALADRFGEAVEVSCDPGMGNAVTAKMVGTWEPATAVQSDVMADVPELTDYQRYAPVKASQAQPCGCPGIGGHFKGCPVNSGEQAPPSLAAASAMLGKALNMPSRPSERDGGFGNPDSPYHVPSYMDLITRKTPGGASRFVWECTLCGDYSDAVYRGKAKCARDAREHDCPQQNAVPTPDQVAARALLNGDQATINAALEQTMAALAEFTPRGRALIPTPMRPARKNRVSRKGKSTRRQRARNRG